MAHFREEVVNVQLAEALISRGIEANPETITRRKQLPDVMVNLGGLKLVIEGRIETARSSLLRHAAKRVTDGLADISMAILYKKSLAIAQSLHELRDQVDGGTYAGALFSFAQSRLRRDTFTGATLQDLAELINGAFRSVVRNDVVRDHVQRVETMIEEIVDAAVDTDLFFESDTLTARLKGALGIAAHGEVEKEDID
jgi:hypothetical protein